MKRRSLLNALPAAVVAGAAPAAALCVVPKESRIIEMFRRHQVLVDAAEAYLKGGVVVDDPKTDEIMDRLFYDEIFQIEDEMVAIPCKTPADFAAKVIVQTSRGGICPNWDSGELFVEARALVA